MIAVVWIGDPGLLEFDLDPRRGTPDTELETVARARLGPAPISEGCSTEPASPTRREARKSEIGVAHPGTSHSAEMPLMGWMAMMASEELLRAAGTVTTKLAKMVGRARLPR